DKSNAKINQSRSHGSSRYDRPRKVDLGDQMRAAHQAVAAVGNGVGKKSPGQQPGISEDRIGNIVRGNTCQPAEKDREYQHGEEGLKNGPGNAERGLFVAHLNIAPGQKIK